MAVDNFCSLRQEVIRTGIGVWFDLVLTSGECYAARLHRVNVVAGSLGPCLQIVRRDRPDRIREVPLATIKELRWL